MTDEADQRRATDISWGDTARILAIMYTAGFFLIVILMMKNGIPPDNKDAINQLLGALTIIQTGIVSYYFGGTKASETMQQKLASGKDRADAAVQELAKAAPAVAAAAVAASAPAKNGHPEPPKDK